MKTALEQLAKILAVAAASLIGSSLAGATLFPNLAAGWEGLLVPGFVAALAAALALYYPVSRSAIGGMRLFAATFAAILGLNVVLTNAEAALFLDMSAGELVSVFAYGALRAALLATLMVLAFGRGERPVRAGDPRPSPRGTAGWVVRVAGCSLTYLVLYFVAGLMILPYVESFYANQNLSVGVEIFPIQLLRGALYLAFALPLLRRVVACRRRLALATAALVPVLAGAVDLLVPNPVMPDWVRTIHMVEVGWSNAVFGLVIGWLFWNPRAGVQATPN